MMLVISYAVLWLTSTLVLWLATGWFPQDLVLGTATLTATQALWLSMGELALILVLSMPFFAEWEHRRGRILTPAEWSFGSLFVSFAGLWLITRLSNVFGLGVTSWMAVAGLALAVTVAHSMAMMKLEKWRTS